MSEGRAGATDAPAPETRVAHGAVRGRRGDEPGASVGQKPRLERIRGASLERAAGASDRARHRRRAHAARMIGGIVQHVWHKVSPKTEDVYNIPLASGFITGEALVLLVLAAAAFK